MRRADDGPNQKGNTASSTDEVTPGAGDVGADRPDAGRRTALGRNGVGVVGEGRRQFKRALAAWARRRIVVADSGSTASITSAYASISRAPVRNSPRWTRSSARS